MNDEVGAGALGSTTNDDHVRKGKSNAILTYELLSRFDQKLTTLVVHVETIRSGFGERDRLDQDHELRLRVLEKNQTTMEASSKTSSGQWRDIWVVGLALLSLALGIVNTVNNIFQHHAG